MSVIGVHLVPTLEHVGGPRRSVIVHADAGGTVLDITEVDDDDAVRAAVGTDATLIVVDAPLVAPSAAGRRDIERVLAWCDITLFPVARDRLVQLHGGVRGETLAPDLDARAARGVWEAAPDQVLRQLVWEGDHPPDAPAMDLTDYRALWPAVRAPRYRPKGAGRGRAAGLMPAWALLGTALDLGGWAPDPSGDDWSVIADAARIDALCCALAGVRTLAGTAVALGTPERGRILVPTDANLRQRIALTLGRMRDEGAIAI